MSGLGVPYQVLFVVFKIVNLVSIHFCDVGHVQVCEYSVLWFSRRGSGDHMWPARVCELDPIFRRGSIGCPSISPDM